MGNPSEVHLTSPSCLVGAAPVPCTNAFGRKQMESVFNYVFRQTMQKASLKIGLPLCLT